MENNYDEELEELKEKVSRNHKTQIDMASVAIMMGRITKNECMEMTGIIEKFKVKLEDASIETIGKKVDFSSVKSVLEQAEKMFDEIMEEMRKKDADRM